MVVRRRRRSNKKRGGRTQHGNTKNWRGGGSRGGRGLAGGHKHKYSKLYTHFGVKIRLKTQKKAEKAVNFDDLNALVPNWLKSGKCEKDSQGRIVLDGKKVGIGKILGSGKPGFELVLVNIALSAKAKEKIEQGDEGNEFEAESESGEKRVKTE